MKNFRGFMQSNSSLILEHSQAWQRPSDLQIHLPETELEKKGLLIKLHEQATEIFDNYFPHATTQRFVAIKLGKGVVCGGVSLLALASFGAVSFGIGRGISIAAGEKTYWLLETAMGGFVFGAGVTIIGLSCYITKEICVTCYKAWDKEEQKYLLAASETNLHLDEENEKKIDQLLPHGTLRRFTAIQLGRTAAIVLALTIIGVIGQPIGHAIAATNYGVEALSGGAVLVAGCILVALPIAGIAACILGCKDEHKQWQNEEHTKLLPTESDLHTQL